MAEVADEERRRTARRSGDPPPGSDASRDSASRGATKPRDPGSDQGKDQPKKPSPLRKTWVRVLIGVVVLLLLLGGIIWFHHWYTHGRFVQGTNDAYLAADDVTISTKVAGTVEQVFVADNQEVAAGQLLVQLDAGTNRTRVAQAEAQAAEGRAQVAEYEAQIREQEAAIAEARAGLVQSEVRRRYAASEVERYGPLAANGAEPGEKLASLVSNLEQAAAQVRQAEASVRQARVKVATLRAQVEVARAEVKAADAQARAAEIDVGSATIRSRVAGRVGDRTVRVGEQAQVGTRFMTIVPDQRLYVIANFKETQVGLMRIGQPASIKVDALSGETLAGEVESFSPGTGAQFALIPPSNASGNFTKIVQRIPVRIRIHPGPEAQRVLVEGMSAEVSVDTVGSRAALGEYERESQAEQRSRERLHDARIREDRSEEPRGETSGPGSPADGTPP